MRFNFFRIVICFILSSLSSFITCLSKNEINKVLTALVNILVKIAILNAYHKIASSEQRQGGYNPTIPNCLVNYKNLHILVIKALLLYQTNHCHLFSMCFSKCLSPSNFTRVSLSFKSLMTF